MPLWICGLLLLNPSIFSLTFSASYYNKRHRRVVHSSFPLSPHPHLICVFGHVLKVL